MIEVRSVTKTFDSFKALDELTLTAPAGGIYGLVGPNGSGKSTIIRHITGVYRQDSGEVLVCGEPVYENDAVKSRIAYIPDDIFYFTQSGVRDMMRFYRGIYPKFSAERYEKLREVFELDEKKPIRRMSKGMQKQAAFWLSMCFQADVLVLDEPVDGLDPVMRRQIWSIIMSDVAEHGTTVLVSSHNLRELEDVCDHVGILDHGKMLLERSLAELQDNIVKVQVALPDGAALPQGLDVVNDSSTGRLHTVIIRGDAAEVENRLAAAQPLFLDILPLTLEEIFIYELGGADYEVKNIIL
ncbi:MAG: ABC transporter ATP-binding protein [Oscillospiraceae bacterium]|nr:ABC transporter ATP-binding protein [Oscillospiraceae bacterium]MCD8191220.1 ABC transporter ATP-binding protein [Oscillospiraceae bacterium]